MAAIGLWVGEEMRKYRKCHRLSQHQLARLLSIRPADICHAETGKSMNWKLAVRLPQLITSLGTVEEFLLTIYPECHVKKSH